MPHEKDTKTISQDLQASVLVEETEAKLKLEDEIVKESKKVLNELWDSVIPQNKVEQEKKIMGEERTDEDDNSGDEQHDRDIFDAHFNQDPIADINKDYEY